MKDLNDLMDDIGNQEHNFDLSLTIASLLAKACYNQQFLMETLVNQVKILNHLEGKSFDEDYMCDYLDNISNHASITYYETLSNISSRSKD